MATATLLDEGREGLAELLRSTDGASTPAGIGGLFSVEIGDGDSSFTDPLNPPAVDPTQNSLLGTQIGSNSSPAFQYLIPQTGGGIFFDGQEYAENNPTTTPTDLLLITWTFATTDANGQWKEILWKLKNSNRAFMKLHPVGSASGWLTKDNTMTIPVRLLLEF